MKDGVLYRLHSSPIIININGTENFGEKGRGGGVSIILYFTRWDNNLFNYPALRVGLL
jgi:hypothetical protein